MLQKFSKMRFKSVLTCRSSTPVISCACSTLIFLFCFIQLSPALLIPSISSRHSANSLQNYSDLNQSVVRSMQPAPATVSSNVTTLSPKVIRSGLNASFYNASTREARRSVVSGGMFSLISFENVPCSATTGDVGVCYSVRECQNLGGTSAGPCAGSYGTCCVLNAGCGSTVSINNTYFVNPGWPSGTSGPLSCTITISLLPGASQLYLEYDKFILDGPVNGSCVVDSMVVTVPGVTGSSYPVLCGNNTGQNDYINLKQATGPVKITFNLAANSDQRCWKIRIVEFKPTDLCAAPAGCTQYLRDLSGTIETYNYNGGQGQLLNNYCINICFQPHTGYCDLLLTEGDFMLSGIAPSDCMGDYLLANGMKFCGETLNNGMLQVNCTTTSPISITVCSDSSNNDGDKGFSLNYNFLPCTTG